LLNCIPVFRKTHSQHVDFSQFQAKCINLNTKDYIILNQIFIFTSAYIRIIMRAIYKFLSNNDLKIILVAVIYFLSAYFGLLIAFQETYTSPVWPPVGIGLALVMILGPRVWPGITIGSLVAFMLVFWFRDITNAPDTIKASILISTGNTLEIVAGYWLLKTLIKSEDLFSKTNDTFIFLLVAMGMCVIGSSFGTFSLYQFSMQEISEPIGTWFFWWIPNVASVLLFTPFILSWKRKFRLTKVG